MIRAKNVFCAAALACPSVWMPCSPSNGSIFWKTSAVTIASSNAVWRPVTVTSKRSAIASSRWEAWFGCSTADSSKVSSTVCSKHKPVAACLICRKRMSKAALWATSTVSCPNAWKAGSTAAMGGLPATICGVMPCIAIPSGGMSRPGFTSWSKHSPRSSRPLTTRVAPICKISSPCAGFRPVVSVSNTV